jgi:predicted nucleotidyltransferase
MNRPAYIEQIKSVINKVAPASEVILYGSEARGEAQEDSDIDLLILVDKDKLSYQEIVDITGPLYDLELQNNCSVSISPLVYTRKQWHERPFRTPFYINVMNEGIRLQ